LLDEKDQRKKQTIKVAQGKNTMRFRKETIEGKDNSTNLSRKEQVVVSRLHFCEVSLTTEYILWECTETTSKRRETVTTREIWTDEQKD
jgi:hypothetical protein